MFWQYSTMGKKIYAPIWMLSLLYWKKAIPQNSSQVLPQKADELSKQKGFPQTKNTAKGIASLAVFFLFAD